MNILSKCCGTKESLTVNPHQLVHADLREMVFKMVSLGEMTTYLPLPGAIPQFATRFVDPALGFATGWNVSPMI
jgi:hypothetical protein